MASITFGYQIAVGDHPGTTTLSSLPTTKATTACMAVRNDVPRREPLTTLDAHFGARPSAPFLPIRYSRCRPAILAGDDNSSVATTGTAPLLEFWPFGIVATG
jgi:hypothetical protein